MPFKSEAQRRKFYAMAGRGEMPRSKVEEYERATKGDIPERVGARNSERSEGYERRKDLREEAEKREMKREAKRKARKKLINAERREKRQEARSGAPVSDANSKA